MSEAVVDDIEATLQGQDKAEAPSSLIGELVMERLKGLDDVAYVRFASVYRQFRDVEQFMVELKDMLNKEKRKARKRKK